MGVANSYKPDSLRFIKWGERTLSQINVYSKFCYDNLNLISPPNTCNCQNILNCTHLQNYYDYIDRYYTHITDVLQSAAIVSSGSCEIKRYNRVPGWNYHVADSHKKARFYFECWTVSGRPSSGIEYENMRNSRAVFKNKLNWCQRNEESIKMNILATHKRNKNFIKFWNATKRLKYKQSLPISVDGCQEPLKIAELFVQKFKVEPLPLKEYVRDTEFCVNNDVIEFTRTDILKVILNMKRGKSPGHDGLSLEHILYASDEIYTHLCHLYNLCIKYGYLPEALMHTIVVPVIKNKTGDLSSASNYRPISLGTIIGKILERLIHPELIKKIKIDDAQFGFRPGLSADDAIASLKGTVSYYPARNTSVYGCFLDLSRAFDLVNYDVLWEKLLVSQVPSRIVNLLRFWYGGQTNSVRWGDAMSSKYRLDCGVRQRGITSPDLFNLYVNGLIEELRSTRVGCHMGNVCVNNLSYADDMVLLSPSVKGLRKLLSVCEHYAGAHGLKYNVAKTEMMVFAAGRGPGRIPEVYLNGTVVSTVKQFRYLGHLLTERLQDDRDIERERRAFAVRGNMLARRFSKCSVDVKVTLFKAYCLGMYTCQLWTTFTQKAMGRIRVQYNNVFRALMKLPWHCSASGMFADAGVPDFFAIIRSRVASYWDRLRCSSNRILVAIFDDIGSPLFKRWISVHMDQNRK